MLPYYAKHFKTVELNASFYFLPKAEYFERWYDQTPKDFVFAIKAPRYITHYKKLSIGKFDQEFIERISILKEKLGPILFQMPPSMKIDLGKLEKFLKSLPSGYEFVFEFRHKSWYIDDTYSLLKKHKAIFCIHDHRNGKTDFIKTSNTIYFRFHGVNGFYGGKYTLRQLKTIWKKILDLKPKKIYAYFNNDTQAFAIKNAQELIDIIKHSG